MNQFNDFPAEYTGLSIPDGLRVQSGSLEEGYQKYQRAISIYNDIILHLEQFQFSSEALKKFYLGIFGIYCIQYVAQIDTEKGLTSLAALAESLSEMDRENQNIETLSGLIHGNHILDMGSITRNDTSELNSEFERWLQGYFARLRNYRILCEQRTARLESQSTLIHVAEISAEGENRRKIQQEDLIEGVPLVHTTSETLTQLKDQYAEIEAAYVVAIDKLFKGVDFGVLILLVPTFLSQNQDVNTNVPRFKYELQKIGKRISGRINLSAEAKLLFLILTMGKQLKTLEDLIPERNSQNKTQTTPIEHLQHASVAGDVVRFVWELLSGKKVIVRGDGETAAMIRGDTETASHPELNGFFRVIFDPVYKPVSLGLGEENKNTN